MSPPRYQVRDFALETVFKAVQAVDVRCAVIQPHILGVVLAVS
jgi:hypothetical protein